MSISESAPPGGGGRRKPCCSKAFMMTFICQWQSSIDPACLGGEEEGPPPALLRPKGGRRWRGEDQLASEIIKDGHCRLSRGREGVLLESFLKMNQNIVSFCLFLDILTKSNQSKSNCFTFQNKQT